ncbi:MAG: hypothetical protein RIC85_03890 [Gammaproteobacteria bacterium]
MDYVKTWLALGKRNVWISRAYDPPFTAESFTACSCDEELAQRVCDDPTSYCLGQAFYVGNICLIQQVDGGDEWLVIRDKVPFESFSCKVIGQASLLEHLTQIRQAAASDLTNLTY